eukprot:5132718-Pleurochrysis_carterae.AAC.1
MRARACACAPSSLLPVSALRLRMPLVCVLANVVIITGLARVTGWHYEPASLWPFEQPDGDVWHL